jgi:hypothetical protein
MTAGAAHSIQSSIKGVRVGGQDTNGTLVSMMFLVRPVNRFGMHEHVCVMNGPVFREQKQHDLSKQFRQMHGVVDNDGKNRVGQSGIPSLGVPFPGPIITSVHPVFSNGDVPLDDPLSLKPVDKKRTR